MATAVKSAVDKGWLTVDSKANAGSGKVPQVNPGGDIPNPQVPTAGSAFAPETFTAAPDSDQFIYQPNPWGFGPDYPSFVQGEWRKGPVQTPTGGNQPIDYQATFGMNGGGVRVTENVYPGYDKHSQTTDDKGWQINTPSGREAEAKLIGAEGVGYENYWYETGARPIPTRLAQVHIPNNSPAGTPGILNGSTLPNWGDIGYGGQGDIAYNTPGPPQTQAVAPASSGSYDWNGWGF